MTNNDYYRTLLLGVVIGMASLSLLVLIQPGEDVKPAEALEPKGTFTVVSEYKGCDVVQWQYTMLAEYKYFLHCNNTPPNYKK